MKSKSLNGTEYLKMFILLSNVLLLLVQRFVSGKQMLCIEVFSLHYYIIIIGAMYVFVNVNLIIYL